jgi:thiol-disulfide isomerase/thioredoxin
MATKTMLLAAFLLVGSAARADDDPAHGHHDRGRFLKKGDAAPPFGPLDVVNPGESKTKAVTFSGHPEGKDRVWILSTFAAWCPGCVTELPVLRRLDDHYRAKGVRIVSVSVDREANAPERVGKLLSSAKVRHAVVDDREQDVLRKYEGGNLSLPYLFVVGPDGVIAETHEGFDDGIEASLHATIDGLLGGK